MVLCWIALPVFAILGIFSVKYRKLTKDSLECLFKTATLRKCDSGLDEKIKSDITGKLMNNYPNTARVFYNHYKIISLVVVILMLASIYFSGVGVYNYIKYGNCNGENSSLFCVIGAAGGLIGLGEPDTQVNLPNNSAIILENITIEQCQKKYNMSTEECLIYCSTK